MKYDPLLFGKNQVERIVGLEITDDLVEAFILDDKGNVSSQFFPHRYWLLANRRLGRSFQELQGNLHYKYGIQFSNQVDWYKAKKQLYHEDILVVHNVQEACMIKDGYTYYKGLKPKEVPVLSFDIETTGLNHDATSKVLLIANTFRKNNSTIRKMFCYNDFPSQKEMIDSWCDWVREIDPSIITGHNIISYDLPYLNYIATKEDTSLFLGRDESTIMISNYPAKFRVDGSRDMEYHRIKCYGRELIDTMFLAIKYDVATKKYENYRLKNIIAQEGLEVANRQFYDADQIRYKYHIPEEWEKIKRYAEMDGDDALALFDLMSPSFFYMCQNVPRSFQHVNESATGALINGMLMRGYLQDKHCLPKADNVEHFQGGISFGLPGIYRNCFKLDIKSAYPSSVLIYKLYDKIKDPKAYMLKLCEHFTYQRFEYKKQYQKTGDEYYKALDAAAKIFINSIFGFCGAPGLCFNSPKIAAKIAESTREFLEKGMIWGTGKNKDYWLSKTL